MARSLCRRVCMCVCVCLASSRAAAAHNAKSKSISPAADSLSLSLSRLFLFDFKFYSCGDAGLRWKFILARHVSTNRCGREMCLSSYSSRSFLKNSRRDKRRNEETIPGNVYKSDRIFFIFFFRRARDEVFFLSSFFSWSWFFSFLIFHFYFVQPTLRAERNRRSPVGRRRDVNKRLIAMQSAQPGGIAIIYLLSLISLFSFSFLYISTQFYAVLRLAFYFLSDLFMTIFSVH